MPGISGIGTATGVRYVASRLQRSRDIRDAGAAPLMACGGIGDRADQTIEGPRRVRCGDPRAKLGLAGYIEEAEQRVANGVIPPIECLLRIFHARQIDRRQPIVALDRRDGECGIPGAPRAQRRAEQDGEALFLQIGGHAVDKGLRPRGDVEIRRVDIEQQVIRCDLKRRGNTTELVGTRHDFAPFDLRQTDIGNLGNRSGETKQFGMAGGAALLAHAIGEDEAAIKIDGYFTR